MDPLEARMHLGQRFGLDALTLPAQRLHLADPVGDHGWDLGPRRWAHAAWKRPDVVLPEGARTLAMAGAWVRRDIPCGCEREAVDVPKLGQRQQLAARPCARVQCLAVDPVGGVGVPTHLHVLPELLVAHRSALLEQLLDLLEHERVALDGSRVMSLLEPYSAPDAVRFARRGQAAEPLAQLADLHTQALVDRSSRRSAAAALRGFVRLRHDPIVPNIFLSVRLMPKQLHRTNAGEARLSCCSRAGLAALPCSPGTGCLRHPTCFSPPW